MNITSPQRLGCDSPQELAGRWSWLCPVTRHAHRFEGTLPTSGTTPGLTDQDGSADSADDKLCDILQIGRFRITDLLGKGGQATTYKAWDPDLKRHVVLKRYHDAESPAPQEAALREGQALARVRSPYVARCYGIERHDGALYLVLEYVPGRSLAERPWPRPMETEEALKLIACVAEGLAAVHACGLLHRDVKPANILVGDDGLPRLVDFGLALPVGDDGLRRVSGTLPFMAPEQARGDSERIDPRTDLFGLGAVLYCLLTGEPPYTARTTEEMLQTARAGAVRPVRERNSHIAPAVGDLCMRCLARDPARRFDSAAALVRAIRHWRRRRSRLAQVTRALSLLLLWTLVHAALVCTTVAFVLAHFDGR